MLNARVIPILLISDGFLVKTRKFREPRYVGDPINAVRIFNEKQVDELFILDIGPCRGRGKPNVELIAEIASEAFMPVAYGGGIRDAAIARQLITNGIEKIVVNSALSETQDLLRVLASEFGSQAVVASLDYKRGRWAHEDTVHTNGGSRNRKVGLAQQARACERAGAGEVLLTSIAREGTRKGMDIDSVTTVARALSIPLVVAGGADGVNDLHAAIRGGASGVAASSMFVFHGPHQAVLITYPPRDVLDTIGQAGGV